MTPELLPLLIAALGIGLLHTLIGPDHYLPFIALAKARQWTLQRTLWITALCGLGHVIGSVVLGAIGIAAGIGLRYLNVIESVRGEIASWLLISFGLVYCVWGVVQAAKNKPHSHTHSHSEGTWHSHTHTHQNSHTHPHDSKKQKAVPWALFLVFVFGPCEPLIPLLMYPAAAANSWAVLMVASVFAITTIITMTAIVLLSTFGLNFVSTSRLERYSHALAGLAILTCGIAVQLGL